MAADEYRMDGKLIPRICTCQEAAVVRLQEDNHRKNAPTAAGKKKKTATAVEHRIRSCPVELDLITNLTIYVHIG